MYAQFVPVSDLMIGPFNYFSEFLKMARYEHLPIYKWPWPTDSVSG